MITTLIRTLALGGVLLCAGCATGPTTYELQNLDPEAFRHDYAECTRKQGEYLFTYDRDPLDPITPFEKCMRDRGYQLSRPG
jgi:hypothetical protein